MGSRGHLREPIFDPKRAKIRFCRPKFYALTCNLKSPLSKDAARLFFVLAKNQHWAVARGNGNKHHNAHTHTHERTFLKT